MKTIAAKEAKDHFGDVLSTVQREPVSILKNGRPAAVVISPEDYTRFQGRQERLRILLDETRQAAQAHGLTPALLHALLAK